MHTQKQRQNIDLMLSRLSHKNCLVISSVAPEYMQVHPLNNWFYATGFCHVKIQQGCVFDEIQWPFNLGFWDVIILDNTLSEIRNLTKLINEVDRLLSNDGVLLVFQSQNYRFKVLKTALKGSKLQRQESYFYDPFSFKEPVSWLPCLLPESQSCYFNASFSKMSIPLSQLYDKAHQQQLRKESVGYAVGANSIAKLCKNKAK